MKRRENLAKAIYDIGKLTFAALVLGQIISSQSINKPIFVLGVIFVLLCFVFAYDIDGNGGNNG